MSMIKVNKLPESIDLSKATKDVLTKIVQAGFSTLSINDYLKFRILDKKFKEVWDRDCLVITPENTPSIPNLIEKLQKSSIKPESIAICFCLLSINKATIPALQSLFNLISSIKFLKFNDFDPLNWSRLDSAFNLKCLNTLETIHFTKIDRDHEDSRLSCTLPPAEILLPTNIKSFICHDLSALPKNFSDCNQLENFEVSFSESFQMTTITLAQAKTVKINNFKNEQYSASLELYSSNSIELLLINDQILIDRTNKEEPIINEELIQSYGGHLKLNPHSLESEQNQALEFLKSWKNDQN